MWHGQRAVYDPVTAADRDIIQLRETEKFMPTSPGDLASLVFDIQDRSASGATLDTLLRKLRAMARRTAPSDFGPRGLIDDVVSQSLELLCRRPPGHFDPQRGAVEGYLKSIVRTAVRDVRDQNQYEPRRRRDYSPPVGDESGAAAAEASCELESDLSLAIHLESSLRGRHGLLGGAQAIAFEGQTVVAAAAGFGLTRTQLTRELARLLDRADLAA